MAFGAEEIYVLTERAAPIPFLRLNKLFEPGLPLVEPSDCPAFTKAVLSARPAVVVSREWAGQGDCVRRIEQQLRNNGYRVERVRFAVRQWQDRYVPDDAHVSGRRWLVYEARGGPPR